MASAQAKRLVSVFMASLKSIPRDDTQLFASRAQRLANLKIVFKRGDQRVKLIGNSLWERLAINHRSDHCPFQWPVDTAISRPAHQVRSCGHGFFTLRPLVPSGATAPA
jgi:hypothetical protein